MAEVIRWVIFNPIINEEVTFLMNPMDGGSPSYNKQLVFHERTAPSAGTIVFEGQNKPIQFQVTGVLLEREQYDFLKSIWDLHHQVRLTDDLGRIFWIYVTDLEFRRIRRARHPWAHEYTMGYVELDVE